MLFNSLEFILFFLPFTLVVFYGLSRFRLINAAMVFLLAASLFFYGFWNIAYLPLLVLSIVVNYALGKTIDQLPARSRKGFWLMWLGIALDLLFLGYYKYAGFTVSSLNGLFQTSLPVPDIVLPLAISFYSFTQIAYLVDAYRGEAHPYTPTTYALFIAFFPQLIAGPILRHDQLIPELERKRIFVFSHRSFTIGIVIFILGLAKKVLIADHLSPWVGDIFSNSGDVSFVEAWFGAIAYTLQLYFDFSGYSDMAVGLGRMFNVHIPINFNSPYKADSIADFWRRWHITLSNFLRDYLYIPLGGNRKGQLRQYLNLFLTMLLGGLWHGAGWTFVLWGGLHGLYLVIHRVWHRLNIAIARPIAQGITFISVLISWVLFRAVTLTDAQNLLGTMGGLQGILLPGRLKPLFSWLEPIGITFGPPEILGTWKHLPGDGALEFLGNFAVLAIVLFVALCLPNTQAIAQNFRPTWKWGAPLGLLAAWSILSVSQVSEFLYFQF